MKSATALLLLALGAEAFAPARVPFSSSSSSAAAAAQSKTALNDVWDDYVGGIDFRGKEFKFDPLSLAETYPPLVPWFRESEIRHCRTAMLAVVGFIVQDFVRIPGEMYSFSAIPKTVDAHDALLKSGPMYQLLFFIGLWDVIITPMAMKATGEGERAPGDYGLTMFGPKDEAGMKKKQESELLNGRLAMCAIGGIATQTVITGHGFPYI